MMRNKRYYFKLEDKKAVPVEDVTEWALWFEKANRIVKSDMISGVHISTVFLGIDHSFMGDLPTLFETMIFGGEHDGYCERYATWEQAEKGHLQAIELIFET